MAGRGPVGARRAERAIDRGVYWSRLKELLARIDARALLADPAIGVDTAWPAACPRFTYPEAATPGAARVDPVDPDPADLLLLQHSSGTTGLHRA